MSVQQFGREQFSELEERKPWSHKGQNGRVLVIGGSELFHTSVYWTADIASRFVDLVHFASPANENNMAVRGRIKEGFWSGIVVDWGQIADYIREDDCVVIGPGMPRDEGLGEGEEATGQIVNKLLTEFPEKKWVIDGGALQEVDPAKLREQMIITPHVAELKRLVGKLSIGEELVRRIDELTERVVGGEVEAIEAMGEVLEGVREQVGGATIVAKMATDVVVGGGGKFYVRGGNEGLTKGGTGDVLAGLVGSLYCVHSAEVAGAGASYLLKSAADRLAERVGTKYSVADVIAEIPRAFGKGV